MRAWRLRRLASSYSRLADRPAALVARAGLLCRLDHNGLLARGQRGLQLAADVQHPLALRDGRCLLALHWQLGGHVGATGAKELEVVHAAARLRLLAAVCVSCNLTSVA